MARKPQPKLVHPTTEADSPIKYDALTEMSIARWYAVPDNPRQRNTERRAQRARHLRIPKPIHQHVAMAVLPDGQQYKVDGHSRSFLWKTGEVAAPNTVLVDVWKCQTEADVKELYTWYDNPVAVESMADRMFGAFREHQPNFESDLLNQQMFGLALKNAYAVLHGISDRDAPNIYELLEFWLPELKLLDSCFPTKKKFPSPLVVGALITFRRYGPTVLKFWDGYQKGLGTKVENERDAIFALDERLQHMRAKHQGKAFIGSGVVGEIVGLSISAVEAFLKDRYYTGGLRKTNPVNIAAFAEKAKNTLRMW